MRHYFSAAILFVLSQALFHFHIQFPATHNFDEFHYIPAAKELITLENNRNEEHPPLAKLIIGAGIQMDGDRPFGWRVMSALFGSLTLIGIFALMLFATESFRVAWVASVMTLFNQMLFVQARIAMLDTFMMAFLVWAIVFLFRARSKNARTKDLVLCGIFLGLATSCKWFGAIGVIACTVVGVWVFKINILRFLKVCVAPAILTYFVLQLPLLLVAKPDYSFWDLFTMPYKMWQAQKSVRGPHPYHSVWYQWPLLIRPMWYAFDKEGPAGEWVRGVMLLGNPLVMFFGLFAWVALFFKRWGNTAAHQANTLALLVFYTVFLFIWAIIPRNVSFYYYYYPASLFLGIFAALFLDQLRKLSTSRVLQNSDWYFTFFVFLVFVHFYPILAAFKIPTASYIKYMWFKSWI